jgi:ankyrin repeat protein
MWVQKRSIDLRNFRLEYKVWKGEKEQGKVLNRLVHDKHEELATYFATRCEVRDDAVVYGVSTLMWVSLYGYLEIVQALLGREGTDVNKGDVDGDTALHYAAMEGRIEVARALLQAGANARKSNGRGQTPLHMASENGCIEIVRALLEAGAGADVRKHDENGGSSPISRACEGKHLEVFRALVEAGGDVNKLDSGGRTALHYASYHGLTEGVRYLCVERGADLNKRTSDGRTPLFLALEVYDWYSEQRKQDKAQIAALLREAGAQEPA